LLQNDMKHEIKRSKEDQTEKTWTQTQFNRNYLQYGTTKIIVSEEV
jgi:hypothetical protein